MDRETYHTKREELVRKYPLYMSKNWLRATRLFFILVLLVLVKISVSTLVS